MHTQSDVSLSHVSLSLSLPSAARTPLNRPVPTSAAHTQPDGPWQLQYIRDVESDHGLKVESNEAGPFASIEQEFKHSINFSRLSGFVDDG